MNLKLKEKLIECIDNNLNISFLTGAGISADSGIPTFRGSDGYWTLGSKNYTPEEIATLNTFKKHTKEVWNWYLNRIQNITKVKPNDSHKYLVDIENIIPNQFSLISQNVDGLHRIAGSSQKNTYLIHGDLGFVRCSYNCSDNVYNFPKKLDIKDKKITNLSDKEWRLLKCPNCNNILRPHVLWFDECYNEIFYRFDTVVNIAKETNLLFILGTSGATTLPQLITELVLSNNGMVVEININNSYFSEILQKHKNGISIRSKSSPFLKELTYFLQNK